MLFMAASLVLDKLYYYNSVLDVIQNDKIIQV